MTSLTSCMSSSWGNLLRDLWPETSKETIKCAPKNYKKRQTHQNLTRTWEKNALVSCDFLIRMRIIIIFFKNTFNYPATWLQNYYSTCSHKSVLCFVPSCFVAFTGKWSHITFLLFRSGSCLDIVVFTHSVENVITKCY